MLNDARLRKGEHLLRLYVAGTSFKSVTAFRNLEKLCEERLPGCYHIEVIDLLVHPHLAKADQILVVPTVVRRLPAPLRKIIGDLSNAAQVVSGLDLRPQEANPFALRKGNTHAR